jgi:predicted TIM-barrel fold metal-dependent hydrolase
VLIDSHTHIWKPEEIEGLNAIREAIGAEKMCIASVADAKTVNDNPALFAAKAAFPDRFYVFPALDHASHFSSGAVATPSLVEQVDRLIELGADGLKLIETKPTHRAMVDIPIDSEHYEAMFARLEETALPILWHVADPEEFWDPNLTPGWAKKQGWGYDETTIPKEHLYSEVANVLDRHPRLRVIFAHFYFLSADLPRAAALFDRYEGVHFDLAPGIELLYNLSKDPDAARQFFVKHTDRIIFGTDIVGDSEIGQAKMRAGLVSRWLETSDEFRIPDGADYVLGPPEDGVIRGIGLSKTVLATIYSGNFERLVGREPKTLNRALALEECRRIAEEVGKLGGDPAAASEAIDCLEAD